MISDTDIDTVKPGTEWAMDKIPDAGYIGLQNHGDPIEFRKIRVREIR
ncbi:MAG: family 16 glycoside hydrolase [Planctomycetota bacterium]